MLSTAMVRMSLAQSVTSSLASSSFATSSASLPMAAWTVALGSHATATKSLSSCTRSVPSIVRYVTSSRTVRDTARMATPNPIVSPSISATRTLAPINPKSRGWKYHQANPSHADTPFVRNATCRGSPRFSPSRAASPIRTSHSGATVAPMTMQVRKPPPDAWYSEATNTTHRPIASRKVTRKSDSFNPSTLLLRMASGTAFRIRLPATSSPTGASAALRRTPIRPLRRPRR
mmetsp:Transcript_2582/g.10819  ORF Transcript_2582/g.10819 Transcript_2582/m.10819 type:complete len:232 (+) Transcript_2582:1406-2101(+)